MKVELVNGRPTVIMDQPIAPPVNLPEAKEKLRDQVYALRQDALNFDRLASQRRQQADNLQQIVDQIDRL